MPDPGLFRSGLPGLGSGGPPPGPPWRWATPHRWTGFATIAPSPGRAPDAIRRHPHQHNAFHHGVGLARRHRDLLDRKLGGIGAGLHCPDYLRLELGLKGFTLPSQRREFAPRPCRCRPSAAARGRRSGRWWPRRRPAPAAEERPEQRRARGYGGLVLLLLVLRLLASRSGPARAAPDPLRLRILEGILLPERVHPASRDSRPRWVTRIRKSASLSPGQRRLLQRGTGPEAQRLGLVEAGRQRLAPRGPALRARGDRPEAGRSEHPGAAPCRSAGRAGVGGAVARWRTGASAATMRARSCRVGRRASHGFGDGSPARGTAVTDAPPLVEVELGERVVRIRRADEERAVDRLPAPGASVPGGRNEELGHLGRQDRAREPSATNAVR